MPVFIITSMSNLVWTGRRGHSSLLKSLVLIAMVTSLIIIVAMVASFVLISTHGRSSSSEAFELSGILKLFALNEMELLALSLNSSRGTGSDNGTPLSLSPYCAVVDSFSCLRPVLPVTTQTVGALKVRVEGIAAGIQIQGWYISLVHPNPELPESITRVEQLNVLRQSFKENLNTYSFCKEDRPRPRA
ncbi:hypothetical protein BDZ89DRAFT_1044836 [Hymenopellis radicata]|nr:hypothetical protein BDZ89DRAFT_1044836 [Hymenopellis radicata]